MNKIFFDSWESLLRSFIITILAYVIMVFVLRISGKRSLSKMNAFDFIITVSLGSALASVALTKQVTLADGALVIFLLIGMQYGVTWLSVRYQSVKELITNTPTLLGYNGTLFHRALKKERLNKEEILVAARKKGIYKLADIGVVIMETTGELTIMKRPVPEDSDTFKDADDPRNKGARKNNDQAQTDESV